MASGSSGRYKEWMDFLLKSEAIEDLPAAASESSRLSFFSGLMQSENLMFDDPVKGRLEPRASGLLASEPLPLDDRPEPRVGRRSFFATLFSREPLPEDPLPGRGAGGRRTGP